MERQIVNIVLDDAAGSFDKPYGYAVPPALAECALPGCRVTVPFGRGDSKRQGLILSFAEPNDGTVYKEIYSVTDKEPVLNPEMLKLCEWMKERYFCTYFDAVHTLLPTGLNYKLTDYYAPNPDFQSDGCLSGEAREVFDFLVKNGETAREKIVSVFENAEDSLAVLEEKQAVERTCVPIRRTGDMTRKWVRLCCDEDGLDDLKLTARQREIADLVLQTGSVSVRELQYFTGVTPSVIETLIRKNVLESFEKQVFRTPYRLQTTENRTEIRLTEEQQRAFDGLNALRAASKPATALLYGVTGSGKTQVFLKLVDAALESGRGIIVMVPEIALTPQMIGIFSSRYGSKIAVFHSAMSPGQRLDEYHRIRKGIAKIAIGTRSAVFAPFSDLGLIIIDEEQEHTYKSERSPRFHAREVAGFRAAYHHALLCLASATPSVETYSAALAGRYSLFTLTSRYGNAVLPQVTTVDMKQEILSGNAGSISRELYGALENVLKNGKQAILLLNRRGHHTYITCPSCGYVATCPNCSVSLTYHSANGRLMCHYCGHSEPAPKTCPDCGGEHVRFLGLGTQKLEEELRLLFPQARVLRMDADSTMTRDAYSANLNDFGAGKYDIMLGTQMVAKGLDFPNVTLVGVVGADQAMYSEDYRSFERTFSLLTQVVGRAGRGSTAGRAVIQSVDPQSNVIRLACLQDYGAFYEDEILTRKVMIFPPFCDICVVCVQSSDRALAQDAIREIFDRIRSKIEEEYADVRLIILGPTVAAMPKINNRYRYRMTVKCKNNRRFRDLLREATAIRLKQDLSVSVDMNPETVI